MNSKLEKMWGKKEVVACFEVSCNQCPEGQEFSLFHIVQTAMGPTQPPIEWVLGAKRQGRAKVKKTWIYTSSPPIQLHGVVLS
jgi:hypothetical protein